MVDHQDSGTSPNRSTQSYPINPPGSHDGLCPLAVAPQPSREWKPKNCKPDPCLPASTAAVLARPVPSGPAYLNVLSRLFACGAASKAAPVLSPSCGTRQPHPALLPHRRVRPEVREEYQRCARNTPADRGSAASSPQLARDHPACCRGAPHPGPSVIAIVADIHSEAPSDQRVPTIAILRRSIDVCCRTTRPPPTDRLPSSIDRGAKQVRYGLRGVFRFPPYIPEPKAPDKPSGCNVRYRCPGPPFVFLQAVFTDSRRL
eukprot:gene24391-9993_t